MDHGLLVDVLDGGQATLRELVFGSDSDVPEHGARQLGEEAFDQIEPGAMLWGEGKFEAPSGWITSQALVSFKMWAEWLPG